MGKKRSRKFRGLRRHGHGMKGRRGKGLRGGKGMAGLCKHRYIWMVKYAPDHWGNYGFTSHHPKKEIKAINLREIEERLPEFIEKGFAREEDGEIFVDLTAAGYNKLLGNGRITRPMKIKVEYASAKAIEKLKSLGGGLVENE